MLAVSSVLSACSADDAPSLASATNTKLAISALAGGVATKATTDDLHELPGEARINNLTALVFDETGTTLLGYKWQATAGAEGEAEITGVEAKTVKVLIALVANTPEGAFADVTNYDAFQSRLITLASQSQTNLSMSSSLIRTNSALDADGNYIGYSGAQNVDGINTPVVLTRAASRVELINVQTRFAGTFLNGRTVRVERVMLTNVKTASRCFSPLDWGVIEAADNLGSTSVTTVNQLVNDNSPIMNRVASFYVFENSDARRLTTLNIRASLLSATGEAEQTREFAAVINQNGLTQGYDHDFIRRNYVYRLEVTFTQSSFENMEAILDVKVQVANWGVIRQYPEID